MRVIIHPTWKCPYTCAYCSVHALGLEKDTRILPVSDWIRWIKALPPQTNIDISGGEPLAYPGIIELIRMIDVQLEGWGMTTNASSLALIKQIADEKFRRCLSINVSVQPQSPPDIKERANILVRAGYPVSLNHVVHPASPFMKEGAAHVNYIPYQAWLEGNAVDGKKRMCDAGNQHVCVNPAGEVYRCLVEMQLGVRMLGTIAEPIGEIGVANSELCDHGCTTCYTDVPGIWLINMREVA